MRTTTMAMLALAFTMLADPAAAQQQDAPQPAGEDEVVYVSARDPAMKAAIRQARDGLDGFLKLAASPEAETTGFKLKLVVSESGMTEHLWVTPFRQLTDGSFEGIVANTPRTVKSVALGQTLKFSRARISDWGYQRKGRQVGSATVCVLFKQMPAAEVENYRKNYGFDC